MFSWCSSLLDLITYLDMYFDASIVDLFDFKLSFVSIFYFILFYLILFFCLTEKSCNVVLYCCSTWDQCRPIVLEELTSWSNQSIPSRFVYWYLRLLVSEYLWVTSRSVIIIIVFIIILIIIIITRRIIIVSIIIIISIIK